MPLLETKGAASAQGFGLVTGASVGEPQYVEDVFSTYLYTGNSSTQTINNGIQLGDATTYTDDQHYRNTVLHVTGDGANGAQNNTFLDGSTNNFTITRNGNTTQGTFSPYGSNWSNYFDGTGDYLTAPNSSAFAFGTGDFTVECWVYVAASKAQVIWDSRASGPSNTGIAFAIDASNYPYVYVNSATLFTSSTALTLNTWAHLAFVKSSGTITLYINGVKPTPQSAAYTGSAASATNLTDQACTVGTAIDYRDTSATLHFNGYISNLRVVKGTAVYTANFTPPTAPLTAITNTSLLTCQNSRLIDNSSNSFTVTRGNDVTPHRFGPFNPTAAYSAATIGGSGYFDGSGDYLTASGSYTLSGNFTVECWVYATAVGNQGIFQVGGNLSATFGPQISMFPNNEFQWGTQAAYTSTTGSRFPLNTWIHVAIVRNSGVMRLYVNGVDTGTTLSDSSSISVSNTYIGVYYGAGFAFKGGYISDFRVVASAVYTGNFTPPTAPLTAIASTNVLLNFTNAGVIDNSTMNALETVGNAQISTSVVKYGTGSVYFDGTGDWLYAPATRSTVPWGTEDWTIEGWIYPTAIDTGYRTIYADGYPIQIYLRSNTIEGYVSSSGTSGSYFVSGLTGPASSVSVNTWSHFAFVKNGSDYKVYVNGVGGSTVTSSTAVAFPGGGSNITVGAVETSGGVINYPYTGYIDDLRVTKGVARYTANFTPPTAALPTKGDNGTLVPGKGGLVWTKERVGLGQPHVLVDTERGMNKWLYSNLTNVETPTTGMSANSNGYAITNLGGQVNYNTSTYVSWTFRKQAKFFDVVTWTGNGTADRQIPHSLGATPGFIVIKKTDSTSVWYCWHRAFTGPGLYLNLPDIYPSDSRAIAATQSSTTLNLAEVSLVNGSGGTYIAYLFAHDAGGFGLTGADNVISCGSFTTDGSGNATVTLGYEPQWILVRPVNTTASWNMIDTMRGWFTDTAYQNLFANSSNAESTAGGAYYRVTSTGFTVNSYPSGANLSFIYIAIRRGPMKVPTDATKVFSPITYAGNGTASRVISGLINAPDLVLYTARNANAGLNYCWTGSRLQGGSKYLLTQDGGGEVSTTSYGIQTYGQTSVTLGTATSPDQNASGVNYILYNMGRAPSFFDVVCYTGNNVYQQARNHNLGVIPELIIIKRRDGATNWAVGCNFTNTEFQYLNLNSGANGGTTNAYTTGGYFGGKPTATTFILAQNTLTNENTKSYVAYLFATCAGVSKVGSYTGTGTTLQIDCGFTNGARFVLIKKLGTNTDAGIGGWFLWDSARGIVSGNDPYLLLNSTAAEVTNTDYIDTYSAGFEISSTAPGTINQSGAPYLFLAIA